MTRLVTPVRFLMPSGQKQGNTVATTKHDNLIKQLCSDSNYEIFRTGVILTLITTTGKRSTSGKWRELVHDVSSDGYVSVRYKYKYLRLHRVIYQKFVGDLDENLTINHKDGNPKNNLPENLEQISQAQNNLHSFRSLKRKPVYGNCKINQHIADRIRSLDLPHKEIAAIYGISETTVSEVKAGKTWKRAV